SGFSNSISSRNASKYARISRSTLSQYDRRRSLSSPSAGLSGSGNRASRKPLNQASSTLIRLDNLVADRSMRVAHIPGVLLRCKPGDKGVPQPAILVEVIAVEMADGISVH